MTNTANGDKAKKHPRRRKKRATTTTTTSGGAPKVSRAERKREREAQRLAQARADFLEAVRTHPSAYEAALMFFGFVPHDLLGLTPGTEEGEAAAEALLRQHGVNRPPREPYIESFAERAERRATNLRPPSFLPKRERIYTRPCDQYEHSADPEHGKIYRAFLAAYSHLERHQAEALFDRAIRADAFPDHRTGELRCNHGNQDGPGCPACEGVLTASAYAFWRDGGRAKD